MGRYIKVYLNDDQDKALSVWQARKEEETGGAVAVNALVNEALRNEMLEQDVYYEAPGITARSPKILRVRES